MYQLTASLQRRITPDVGRDFQRDEVTEGWDARSSSRKGPVDPAVIGGARARYSDFDREPPARTTSPYPGGHKESLSSTLKSFFGAHGSIV